MMQFSAFVKFISELLEDRMLCEVSWINSIKKNVCVFYATKVIICIHSDSVNTFFSTKTGINMSIKCR